MQHAIYISVFSLIFFQLNLNKKPVSVGLDWEKHGKRELQEQGADQGKLHNTPLVLPAESITFLPLNKQ